MLGATDTANRAFATGVADKAKIFLDALVEGRNTYLSSLNSAGSARDTKLNQDLTHLLGQVVMAEGVYNRALVRAGRAHDMAVVGAATARDGAVLGAMNGLFSSTASGGPTFTEAAPIRAALSKLEGVVGATTAVLNQ